jgi:hypothetical protein
VGEGAGELFFTEIRPSAFIHPCQQRRSQQQGLTRMAVS